MPRCVVVKGGWLWKGHKQNVGDIIDGVSAEWIQNRVNDGGLVAPLADVPPPIETAAVSPPETTSLPSARGSAKRK